MGNRVYTVLVSDWLPANIGRTKLTLPSRNTKTCSLVCSLAELGVLSKQITSMYPYGWRHKMLQNVLSRKTGARIRPHASNDSAEKNQTGKKVRKLHMVAGRLGNLEVSTVLEHL